MTPQNEVLEAYKVGKQTAREAIEKSEPFFTIAVAFGVGAGLVARAAWEHDIFGIVIIAVVFFVLVPLVATWRRRRSSRQTEAGSD
jgi:Flp pilus assembly protein TadB